MAKKNKTKTYTTPYGDVEWKDIVKRSDFLVNGEATEIHKIPITMEEIAQLEKAIGKKVTPTTIKSVLLQPFKIVETIFSTKTNTQEAQANTTTPTNLNGVATVLISSVETWIKAKKTPAEIMEAHLKSGFQQQQIQQVIIARTTPTPPQATPTPTPPTIEELF